MVLVSKYAYWCNHLYCYQHFIINNTQGLKMVTPFFKKNKSETKIFSDITIRRTHKKDGSPETDEPTDI